MYKSSQEVAALREGACGPCPFPHSQKLLEMYLRFMIQMFC